MIKKITLTIIILLFISGCNVIQNSQEDITTNRDFKIGTQGIEVNFLDNMPPSKIFEEDSFELGLELNNKGAYDSKDVYISRWYHFSSDFFEIEKGDNEIKKFPLRGKSALYPNGEKKSFIWNLENKKFPEDERSPQELFSVDVCYDYETFFSGDICVDPYYNQVIDELKIEGSCITKDITSSGQGAPIAVTKVETKPSITNEKIKLTFYITIENKKDGQLVGDSEKCSSEVGEVTVEEIQFSDFYLYSGINCKNFKKENGVTINNIIDLKDKKYTLVCNVALDKTKSAYPTPLSIKLKYNYKIPVQSKKVKLVKVNDNSQSK